MPSTREAPPRVRLRTELRRLGTRPLVVLVAIVLVGAGFRLYGVDWDDGGHLHPDERYLTIVADHVDWPASPTQYFDVESSPLSPYNTDSGAGYLYGELPLVATKVVAAALGRDTYDEVHLVGRVLSALVDSTSIVLVFLIARLLLARERYRDAGALLAAAFYALAVTAIQHAHFFTMESWLVLATLATFFVAARLVRAGRTAVPLLAVAALGAALGLTAATKVSGLLVAAPALIAAGAVVLWLPGARRDRALAGLVAALVLAGAAYVSFRLVSPYAFEHSNWLYVEPNRDFRAALQAQQDAIDGAFLYPPAYQWLLSRPWLDPLRNETVWGLGLPLGLAAVAGVVALLADLVIAVRRRAAGLDRPWVVRALMLLVFVALTYGYFASRFAHSIRYLLPIVPFLCIAAAYGVCLLARSRPRLAGAGAALVLVLTLGYALAFESVYRSPNTRMQASTWLLDNVPSGAQLVSEHWDDALPVHMPPDRFVRTELPVFDPDDDTKLRKLYDGLAPADVYVLSSPRAWRTIGRLPDRFPLMTRFYGALRDGRLGFVKAAQFESPPRLLGVTLSDLGAEEPFWVYDHPPVIVYRRAAAPSWETFAAAICSRAPTPPGCPR